MDNNNKVVEIVDQFYVLINQMLLDNNIEPIEFFKKLQFEKDMIIDNELLKIARLIDEMSN